ncbi:MAG: hypothetical protein EOP86_14515 [Verrucomicrobiaceae bacterium]|nr:MAG: hypothetical protein EOP86_14515 [Verrucomicrobiaceae bacterium]
MVSTQAAVIFADDFSESDGTVLKGKTPDTGISWEQTGGTDVTIQGGVASTVGAARVVFGNFTGAPSVAEPLLTVTFDTTLISHNGGYAGVSLFAGTDEKIFIGDLSGDTTGWGLSISGGGSGSNDTYSGAHTVTISYDFSTGLTQLFDGASASGVPLLTQNAAPGLELNRLRIANDGGGDIALNSVLVQTSPVPEASTFAFLLSGLGILLIRRRR